MKKLLVMLVALCVLFSSCTYSRKDENNKINVICTAFPQYDFVREIAGDNVNLKLLLPPGAEAHSYDPTPRDIIALSDSDIFIMIGGESEHWAMHLLKGQKSNSRIVVNLFEHVTKYAEENIEGMETDGHTHNHENSQTHDEEHTYDEHIWTSPHNAASMCSAITDALCKADSKNADIYIKNLDIYTQKLKELEKSFLELRKNSKRKLLVFGDRFPMRYLIEFMDLKYYAAFPGCSSKTEPSAKTIAFLSDKVKESDIPVVLYMDYSDGRIAKTIAMESDAKAKRLYSCHNLSEQDINNGESYISLMTENLNVLKEALN